MMTSSNGNIFRVTGHLCGKFPAQRPVTRSFDVFFDLRLNKRLSKQPWGWWFETPVWSLWRHRNDSCKIGYDPIWKYSDISTTLQTGKRWDGSLWQSFFIGTCWFEFERGYDPEYTTNYKLMNHLNASFDADVAGRWNPFLWKTKICLVFNILSQYYGCWWRKEPRHQRP